MHPWKFKISFCHDSIPEPRERLKRLNARCQKGKLTFGERAEMKKLQKLLANKRR